MHKLDLVEGQNLLQERRKWRHQAGEYGLEENGVQPRRELAKARRLEDGGAVLVVLARGHQPDPVQRLRRVDAGTHERWRKLVFLLRPSRVAHHRRLVLLRTHGCRRRSGEEAWWSKKSAGDEES
jgi:hypothetical protein